MYVKVSVCIVLKKVTPSLKNYRFPLKYLKVVGVSTCNHTIALLVYTLEYVRETGTTNG